MRRSGIIALVILVAFVALGTGCIMAPKEGEIRYGGQYYPGEFLLFGLGDEIWDKYDLNVTHILFTSAGESNEALIAGTIDINVGADTRTVSLFTAVPEEALIIGTVQRGNRYSTIVKVESNYQTWQDLKGKKIGIKLGTGAEGVLRKYFVREGISWEDYEWVNLNVEDMIANLEQGTIEAFHAWEFFPAIAEAKGIGRILRTYGDVALVPASIHTTTKFVEENRDLVVRFLAAQLEKADIIKNDPDRAAELAAKAAAAEGQEVSEDAFKRVFERINFQIEFNQTIIDAIHDTAEFLREQGKIEEVPTLTWDDSLLEDAKKEYEKRK